MRENTRRKTLFGIIAAAVMMLCMSTAVFAGSIAEGMPENSPAPAAYVAMPTNFIQTSAGKTSVTLSWSPVADAQYYLVAFGKDVNSAKTTTTSNTSITFSGLAQNTIYRASIAAVAADGSYSDAVPDIFCRTLPTAPKLQGRGNDSWTSVTLYYNTAASAATEGYQVKYTNLKTKRSKTVYTGLVSEKLELNKNTFYKVVIKGYVNVNGKKAYGPSTTTYVACQPSLKSKASGKGAKITWSKVTGAKNYTVYVSTTGPSSGYKKKKVTTATSYKLTNMTLWKNYYIYVKANRKVGSKTYSSPTNGYIRVYRYLK